MIHDRSPFPDEFDYNHSIGASLWYGKINVKKKLLVLLFGRKQILQFQISSLILILNLNLGDTCVCMCVCIQYIQEQQLVYQNTVQKI